jgi:tetratricopeptide (TPR) repeat protein
VFWKVAELLVRTIYFRRFRAAKRIGKAGALLNEGQPEQALELIEKTGKHLHQSLLPLYALVRGRILDGLGRVDEAEEAFKLVVLADPESAKADLELALLTGRGFRFDECRTWLDRLEAKSDEDIKRQAAAVRQLLDQITSGAREAEFERRARAMAEEPIAADGGSAGFPPDLTALGTWLAASPERARDRLDEIALLVGQAQVHRGARWKISLSLEESVVVRDDGAQLNPFTVIDAALREGQADLAPMVEDAWQPPDAS